MRLACSLIVLIVLYSCKTEPVLPEFLQERVAHCDSCLTEAQAGVLRAELRQLESYFVRKEVLKDRSAGSYRKVYEQLAAVDFTFEKDTSFDMLDTLPLQAYQCLYKTLTPEGFSEYAKKGRIISRKLTVRHTLVSQPALANQVLDSLSNEELKTEYCRYFSLVFFYNASRSMATHDELIAGNQRKWPGHRNVLVITITDTGKTVNGKRVAETKINSVLYDFLKADPKRKTIEIAANPELKYSDFIALVAEVENVYKRLKNDVARERFGKTYEALPVEERARIDAEVPVNIKRPLQSAVH